MGTRSHPFPPTSTAPEPKSAGAKAPARHEAELRRLDRLAALGALVGDVAHEVRNPLVAVKTLVHLLPAQAEDPDFRERFAALVGEEVERMERLLDLLVEVARSSDDELVEVLVPAPDRRGPCDVATEIAAVRDLLAYRAKAATVELDIDVAPDLPPAAIAPPALRQVLLNLTLRAIDHTAPGSDVRLAARRLGPAVELFVEDRGAGESFEPFAFSIAQRIIRETGGTLVARVRDGGGRRMRIRVPAHGAERQLGSDP